MKYAIYSRKSKFTGKGDSIENQVQLCKNYLYQKCASENIELLIYEDEGFSGSHIERPSFQQLLSDAKAGYFEALICYRIDRVSRNVADFARLIQLLDQYRIHFISISELFDTSTPMGRTMLYIISAFAQLERETTAERIRDNMLHLAKSGRWLGGITPTGFSSEEKNYRDAKGKDRKLFQLIPIPNEIALVQSIYYQFLNLKSLSQLESYFGSLGLKSKNNRAFSRVSLKNILHNPVYATADSQLLKYLRQEGFQIDSPDSFFDGTHGLMAYNKTIQTKHHSHTLRAPREWIIAVGNHPGIISSHDWIQTQELLHTNNSQSYPRGTGDLGILSGLLKCEKCGSYMRPKCGRLSKKGIKLFYYICEQKERTKGIGCDIKNAQGNEVDTDILNALSTLAYDPSCVASTLADPSFLFDTNASQYTSIQSQISRCDTQINQLLTSLAQTDHTNVQQLILQHLYELDTQKKTLESQLITTNCSMTTPQLFDATLWNEMLISLLNTRIHLLSPSDQKQLIKPLIDTIYWDGTQLKLFLTGTHKKD